MPKTMCNRFTYMDAFDKMNTKPFKNKIQKLSICAKGCHEDAIDRLISSNVLKSCESSD